MTPHPCQRRFMTERTLRLAIAACLLAAAPLLAAGKLDEARDAVRGSSSSGQRSEDTSDDDDDHTYDERADAAGHGDRDHTALDYLCILPVLWPICFPMWAMERAPFTRDAEAPFGASFHAYPYAAGSSGHLITAPLDRDAAGQEPPDDPFGDDEPALSPFLSMRMSAEYAYDLDGGIHRPGGGLLLDSNIRVGLESAWSVYIEPLTGGMYDELVFGDVNVFFRVAQDEHAESRLGVGARLMLDGDQVDAGFNATWALDVFPVDPLVLSLSIDAGNLGYAFVSHSRATVGLMLSRVELYAGYDVKTIDAIVFHGPLGGLRVWF